MTDRPDGGKDELSSTLRDLRKAAELNTRQAAERSGFSQAKVSRIERGVSVPTEANVAALLDVYRIHGEQRRVLLGMARGIRAEHRPVVMARGKGYVDEFQNRLARIEAACAHVRAFTPVAVPGLLQTETYMRAVMASPEYTPQRVESFVAGRLKRQAGLGEPGRQYTLVSTVGGLGWRLGSREDMATQVDHIATMVDSPGLRVGVIPWGVRAPRLILHGFDIYDERAVSYGVTEATAILTEPRDVARYIEFFGLVEEMAAWGDDARAVLAEVAHQYRTMNDGV